MDENTRKALEFELAGYVRRGLVDRANQVRALLGDVPADVEQASAAPGERRTVRRKA